MQRIGWSRTCFSTHTKQYRWKKRIRKKAKNQIEMMGGLALPSSPWISGNFPPDMWKFTKYQLCPSGTAPPPPSLSHHCNGMVCRSQLGSGNGLKFVLHDALDSSGIDTTHARVWLLNSFFLPIYFLTVYFLLYLILMVKFVLFWWIQCMM